MPSTKTYESFGKSAPLTASDFRIYTPVSVFEKADAPEGQRRRIGGIVSSESRDRQDEVILQRGLDFGPFLSRGFYNDNHSKSQLDVLGEPTEVRYVKKGERLPDGTSSPANGHWAEGILYAGDPKADALWSKAQAMAKAGGKRRLGFSIEGKILKREDADRRTIAKAEVHHVALTHQPVNCDTGMSVLAKSLVYAESGYAESQHPEPDGDEGNGGLASLVIGEPVGDGDAGFESSPSPTPSVGTMKALSTNSGNGGPLAHGSILSPISLDSKQYPHGIPSGVRTTQMSKSELVAWLGSQIPHAPYGVLERLVDNALIAKSRGYLSEAKAA